MKRNFFFLMIRTKLENLYCGKHRKFKFHLMGLEWYLNMVGLKKTEEFPVFVLTKTVQSSTIRLVLNGAISFNQ